jgi:hypothetical protein
MEEGWRGKKGEKSRRYRASLSLGHYASELRKVRSGEPTAHFGKEGIARIMLGQEETDEALEQLVENMQLSEEKDNVLTMETHKFVESFSRINIVRNCAVKAGANLHKMLTSKVRHLLHSARKKNRKVR